MIERYYLWYLRHRVIALLVLVAVTGLAGWMASKVKSDFDPKQTFPVDGPERAEYDRQVELFDHDESRIIFSLSGPRLLTPEGLRLIASLEDAIARLPYVVKVKGPLSADDIVAREDWVQLEKLFPSVDLPQAEIDRRVQAATGDPLFRWAVIRPDGGGVNILATVTRDCWERAEKREEFTLAADRMVAAFQKDHAEHTLVTSGFVSARVRFADLIAKDSRTLVPLALAVVLVVLFIVFRSLGAVLAGLVALLTTLLWSRASIGLMGFPDGILTAATPIILITVTIADTVHIVNDFLAGRRSGLAVREAVAHAMQATLVPCLLTELVIAAGFVALLSFNLIMVRQFALVTAVGVLLIWLQNATVLPLMLSFVKRVREVDQGGRASSALMAIGQRAIGWMSYQTTERPLRVTLATLLVTGAAAYGATHVRRETRNWDDLRPESREFREMRAIEQNFGGVIQISVLADVAPSVQTDNPALEPHLLRVMDRAVTLMRTLPHVAHAGSLADPLRKVHSILSGDPGPDGLPGTRALAAQELSLIDDGNLIETFVTFDRRALLAVGFVPDVGSSVLVPSLAKMRDWAQREQAELDKRADLPKVQLSVTGASVMAVHSFKMLTKDIVSSLLGAVLVTFIVFCVILRSVKLGLIGLAPNVLPVVVLMAVMALGGIRLRVSVGVLFAVVLVLADEDTIQFLSRYRAHYRRALERVRLDANLQPHKEAVRTCMQEVGLPMLVTSTAISAGFLVLLASEFLGLAHMGILLGCTLFSAMFADLFFMPVVLVTLRPRMLPKTEEEAILKGTLTAEAAEARRASVG